MSASKRITAYQWVAIVVALAILATGVIGVAYDWATIRYGVLFAVGLACLVFGLFGDRITNIDLSIDKGAPSINITMDSELKPGVVAELNDTGLAGVAATYTFVHNQLADDEGSHKTKVLLQDQLIELVRRNAFNQPIDEAEVNRALTRGSPAERVLAYGFLLGYPDLATAERLEEGIARSKSGNEQYQALLVTQQRWANLSTQDQLRLGKAIEGADYLRDDPERKELAERIMGRKL
ncbi:hypothetical protein [Nocardioides sp. NPDC127503]|uniref:hypothetical protein n=1 Tax=Nocardioides sp. NPDC127503 TaxID=3154516 RepID=UPI00331E5D49